MRAREFTNEVNMDSRNGAGAVPFNADVDYFGVRVNVQPLTWLRLATELTVDPSTEKKILELAKYIKDGGKVGPPFFHVTIPESWHSGDLSESARITGHEGRHRMEAIIKAEGNDPVEVHLFLNKGLRARDLTPEWLARLNQDVIGERGNLMQGPWFSK